MTEQEYSNFKDTETKEYKKIIVQLQEENEALKKQIEMDAEHNDFFIEHIGTAIFELQDEIQELEDKEIDTKMVSKIYKQIKAEKEQFEADKRFVMQKYRELEENLSNAKREVNELRFQLSQKLKLDIK